MMPIAVHASDQFVIKKKSENFTGYKHKLCGNSLASRSQIMKVIQIILLLHYSFCLYPAAAAAPPPPPTRNRPSGFKDST